MCAVVVYGVEARESDINQIVPASFVQIRIVQSVDMAPGMIS